MGFKEAFLFSTTATLAGCAPSTDHQAKDILAPAMTAVAEAPLIGLDAGTDAGVVGVGEVKKCKDNVGEAVEKCTKQLPQVQPSKSKNHIVNCNDSRRELDGKLGLAADCKAALVKAKSCEASLDSGYKELLAETQRLANLKLKRAAAILRGYKDGCKEISGYEDNMKRYERMDASPLVK